MVFHLDNDRTGRLATRAIPTVLPKKYRTRDEPPKQGKDCNDSLCIRLGIRQTKRDKSDTGGRDFGTVEREDFMKTVQYDLRIIHRKRLR